MQDLAKPAIVVALLAAVGIGCYTWGQHKSADPAAVPSPYPTASQPPIVGAPGAVAPSAINPASLADQATTVTTTRTARMAPGITSQTTSSARSLPVAPSLPMTPGAPRNPNQPLLQEEPVATVPYAGTTTVTPVESTTVVEKKTVVMPARHVAYTEHRVHYKHHKTDKVHIARATKHGVMFALKLPGRAAL